MTDSPELIAARKKLIIRYEECRRLRRLLKNADQRAEAGRHAIRRLEAQQDD